MRLLPRTMAFGWGLCLLNCKSMYYCVDLEALITLSGLATHHDSRHQKTSRSSRRKVMLPILTSIALESYSSSTTSHNTRGPLYARKWCQSNVIVRLEGQELVSRAVSADTIANRSPTHTPPYTPPMQQCTLCPYPDAAIPHIPNANMKSLNKRATNGTKGKPPKAKLPPPTPTPQPQP